MNNPVTRFLMVGLPESGKSTFLAALWEVVRSDKVDGALKLGTLHGDYSYINKLHELWSEGIPLSRTKFGKEGLVTISLKDNQATETTMVIPDLSGESFDFQWELRTVTKDYYDHLLDVSGLIVFVHSQKLNAGALLNHFVNELEAMIGSEIAEEVGGQPATVAGSLAKESTQDESKALPFEPKNVPTQTKVVDVLIQAFRISRRGHGIKRVALVVSAWDLVQTEFASPTQWLDTTMPLLSQFLNSNSREVQSKVYGISAQGADLNQQNQKEYQQNRKDLLKLPTASDRITITDGEITNKNITAPLQWLARP